MSYEKTSNKDPTSYTKSADLQQLKEELAVLRERRKSRRHSQLLPTVSSSSSPSPPPSSSLSSSSPHTIIPTMPAKVHDLTKNQLPQPSSKEDSEIVDSTIENTPPSPIITRKTSAPKKERKVVLPNIITSTEATLSEGTEQSFEEHSILLAKLKVSTRRTDRKTNRTRPTLTTGPEEDDPTTELLLKAFQNLSGTQSTPVCKSQNSNPAEKIKVKTPTPTSTVSCSSSSRPFKKNDSQSSWKKQSSLSKLKSVKGKVSTAISALENSKAPSACYGSSDKNRPPRPLVARYELPSPHHQQSFNIDASLPLSTPVVRPPVTMISSVDRPQPPSSQPSRRPNGQRKKGVLSPSTSTPTTSKSYPRMQQILATIPASQPTPQQKDNKVSSKTTLSNGSKVTILRPLSLYTPQLSPSAGDCHLNLSGMLPSSDMPVEPILSPLSPLSPPLSPPPAQPLIKTDEKSNAKHSQSQPPVPPPHQWPALKDKVSNITTSSRPLRVINVNSDDNLDTIRPTDVDQTKQPCHHSEQLQHRQQHYSSAEDDTTDSSISDDDHGLSMTSRQPYPHQRKRYSDGSYFDHRYDYHITTTMDKTEDMNTGNPARQKKVSFSSTVTTIPGPAPSLSSSSSSSSPVPTPTHLHDYPKCTRGFWEAFSAEMGHQQRPELTLMDQMDAIKSQKAAKYLPVSQHHHPRHIDHPSQDSSPPVPTSKLFGIQKLLGKSKNDQEPSWWKGVGNKKQDPPPQAAFLPPLSASPPLNHPTKSRPKKPSSFRKTENYANRLTAVEPMAPAATAQPQWRQRVPLSKHHV
ncbi:hypothetical protein [Absidia glauca]|uniref:Uncharacterized protein n=1 Tax=Absidia glauca TaxID=4829 RepID=A0A163K1A8_ABSGL|nr:hypothetical protein [Absidia glauca]